MHLKPIITIICIFCVGIGFLLSLTSEAAYCADTATVIKLNTILRESSSEESEKVLLLKKAAVLALIDREDSDGWLNVIDIKTGKEGWVKKKHVSLVLSNKPKPELVFNDDKIDEISNPEIEVENVSDKDLTLKVSDARFVVPKHSKKAVIVPPGEHKYHASAPNVYPAIGKNDFRTGHRYTWKFWIESRRR